MSKKGKTFPVEADHDIENNNNNDDNTKNEIQIKKNIKSKSKDKYIEKTATIEKNKQDEIITRKEKALRRKAGDIELKRKKTIEVIIKYQMGQTELKKFRQCFAQIDLDQSGSIDYEEFFEFIDETRTPFTDGLFRVIDSDGNGALDFEEFVHAITSYCMYTREEILRFAYDTFDADGSGAIDEMEFMKLCKVVNDGKPAFPGNFKRALQEFDKNGDGLIDFDEFQNLNKRYPLILFPCFRLQDRMQKSTLSEHHWHTLAKRYYQQLKLIDYKRKHNGAAPPVSFITKVLRMFGIGVIDVYQI